MTKGLNGMTKGEMLLRLRKALGENVPAHKESLRGKMLLHLRENVSATVPFYVSRRGMYVSRRETYVSRREIYVSRRET